MGQPLHARRTRSRDGPSHKQACRLTPRLRKRAVSEEKPNSRQNLFTDTPALTAGSSLSVEYPPRHTQGYDEKGQQKKDIVRHRRQALAAHKNF